MRQARRHYVWARSQISSTRLRGPRDSQSQALEDFKSEPRELCLILGHAGDFCLVPAIEIHGLLLNPGR